MIRLYKDIRIKYYLTEIIGIVLLILMKIKISDLYNNKIISILMVLGIIVYIFIIAAIYLKIVLDRLTKLSNIMRGNENLKEGIKEYEKIYARAKDKKIKTLILTSLTGAYINIGDTKKAMALYEDFEPVFQDDVIGLQNQFIYLNNVCEICIREGLYKLAHNNIYVMKQILDTDKISEDNKIPMTKIYQDLVIELVFKEDEIKDYKSIEKYYLKRFNEEEEIYNKVFFAYQLSKVYKKLKKKKAEKEYKEYYESNRKELNYN